MKDEGNTGIDVAMFILCIFMTIWLTLGNPDIIDGIIKILNK